MSLKLKDFVIDPCKSDKAIAFMPQKKVELPLSELAEKLSEGGASIQAETPFVLIFRFRNASISLFKSGKLLVKELDENKAKEIVETILRIIE
ncbi:MAG: hypothetical protein J7L44_03200 [Candidatus Diapherotrites archaeon]|nr:hypothetical protein [Candidatus Diapherotrites archaeon]